MCVRGVLALQDHRLGLHAYSNIPTEKTRLTNKNEYEKTALQKFSPFSGVALEAKSLYDFFNRKVRDDPIIYLGN